MIDELEVILTRSQFILDDTVGLNYDAFLNHRMAVNAVERNLEVIGIAAVRIRDIDPGFYEDFQVLREPVAVRNRLAHGYDDDISYEILWKIITKSLPTLMESIRKQL